MATKWSTLRSEVLEWLGSPTEFSTTGDSYPFLIKWADRAISVLHEEIDMFYKLQYIPASVTFTTANYYASLPTDFFKKSDRFTYIKYQDTVIPIIGLDELNALDPRHNDTTTNVYPDYVAIEAGKLFAYPMFAGTITIEGYFTKPTALAYLSVTGTDIAFVDNTPNKDTITRTAADFVTAGFTAGDTLTVTGSTSNNSTSLTLYSVAVGTLTMIAADTLTAEIAGASVTLTSSNTTAIDVPDSDNKTAHDLIIAYVLYKAFMRLQDSEATSFWGDQFTLYLELYRRHIKQSDSKKKNTMVYY